MSVSFYPSIDTSVAHTVVCACGSWRGETFENRSAAADVLPGTTSGCDDPYCGEYLYVTPAVAEPEVNLSNTNAEELAEYLGFNEDDSFHDVYVGEMTADEVLARVAYALNRVPENTGLTTMRIDNHIYCGRPSDYMQVRLTQLGAVALWSKDNGRTVTWS